MKKLSILVLFVLFATMQTQAQHQQKRERIKSIKTAYLTEELNLNSQEAEKFWPVYNKYEKEIFSYKVQKTRKELKRIEELEANGDLNDEIAEKSLQTLIEYENRVAENKQKMFKELKGILSTQRILKLYRAELAFNRKLLSEIRKRGFKEQNRPD